MKHTIVTRSRTLDPLAYVRLRRRQRLGAWAARSLWWTRRWFTLTVARICLRLLGDKNRLEVPPACLPPPRRVLIIRLDRVGDMVLTLPCIRELKRNLPDTQVDALCSRYNRGVIDGSPYIDNIYVYDASEGWRARWSLVQELRRRRYDMAIDLEDSALRPAILAYSTSAVIRTGFDNRTTLKNGEKGIFYTFPVRANAQTYEQYYAHQCLGLIEALGYEVHDRSPEPIPVSESDRRRMHAAIDQAKQGRKGPLVGIHPGSIPSEPGRQWAPEEFAQVVDRVSEDYGATVILLGSEKERDVAKRICQYALEEPVDFVGKTTIKELAAAIEACDMLICNDSGPFHMGIAQCTPAVCIVGPSSLKRWHGPYGNHRVVHKGLRCSPCDSRVCPYEEYYCMSTITVGEVLREVEIMFRSLRIRRTLGDNE